MSSDTPIPNGSVSSLWKALFLVSVTINISLVGAWYTHSVSKEELQRELSAHQQVTAAQIEDLKQSQSINTEQWQKLDELREDMIRVKIALGIAEYVPRPKPR